MAAPAHEPSSVVHEPTIVEDLETGDFFVHGAQEKEDSRQGAAAMGSVPDLRNMSLEYQEAVLQSSKARRSKGTKRILSLHKCIEQKKAKGEWQGCSEQKQRRIPVEGNWECPMASAASGAAAPG